MDIDIKKLLPLAAGLLTGQLGLIVMVIVLIFIGTAIQVIPKIKVAPVLSLTFLVVLVCLGLIFVHYCIHTDLVLLVDGDLQWPTTLTL